MNIRKNNNQDQTNTAEPIQRWTAKRKAAVILEIIKGTTTPAQVARQHDLTVAEVDKWQAEFFAGAEQRLKSNPKEAAEEWHNERRELHAKIGELTLEVDAAKKQLHTQLRANLGENW